MKRNLSVIIALTLILSSLSVFAPALAEGYDEAGYFLVNTEAEFKDAVLKSEPKIKLMSNLTLGTSADVGDWEPIPYEGELEGNNKTITLYIKKTTDATNVGLFSTVQGDIKIRNLNIEGSVSLSGGGKNVGSLVGDIVSSTNKSVIENITNRANINITGVTVEVGGIIGNMSSWNGHNGILDNLHNYGNIVGRNNIGGICAQSKCSIINSSNHGNINGQYGMIGGICGRSYSNINISGCYNEGTITNSFKGDIAGILAANFNGDTIVENCYNIGDLVSDNENVTKSGIASYVNCDKTITIRNCYNLMPTQFPVLKDTVKITAENSFYLDKDLKDDNVSGTTAKNIADMKNSATELGAGFTNPIGEYQFPEIVGNLYEGNFKLYELNITTDGFGTVSDSVLYVKKGDLKSISVTADEGYTIESVVVNGILDSDSNILNQSFGNYEITVLEDTNLYFTFSDGYIKIKNAEDFMAIKNNPGGKYKLVNDIVLGSKEAPFDPFDFSGEFIGSDPLNLKTITLYIDNKENKPAGLFSMVTGTPVIKNIKIKGEVNSIYAYIGSAIGRINDAGKGSVVSNIVNEATISYSGSGTGTYVGGIMGAQSGWSSNTEINNLINKGNINTKSVNYIGGIAGSTINAVSLCANTGNIGLQDETTDRTATVGGIVGRVYSNISKCINNGNIEGTIKLGGIGGAPEPGKYSISDCINHGKVISSADSCAGIIFNEQSGKAITIKNCYSTSHMKYPIAAADAATITNCYYMVSDNYNDNVEGTEAKNITEFETLASLLGSAFEDGLNGYPVLTENSYKPDYKFYVVSVTLGENGTLENAIVGDNYVKGGDTFKIQAVPNKDYLVDEVVFDGVPVTLNQYHEYVTPKINSNKNMAITFIKQDLLPDNLTSTIYNGPMTVSDFSGKLSAKEIAKISNNNAMIAFATISAGNKTYERTEFGFVLSVEVSDPLINTDKCVKVDLTQKFLDTPDITKFGVVFYGNVVVPGTNYYIKPYAVYGGETVYGEVMTMNATKISE